MDPHFNEYLAAIAGMHETYGERTDDHPSEFHHPADCHADECHPSSLHADRGALMAGTASGVASAT